MRISFYIQNGPWTYSTSNSLLKVEMAEPGLKKILGGKVSRKNKSKLPRTSLAHTFTKQPLLFIECQTLLVLDIFYSLTY